MPDIKIGDVLEGVVFDFASGGEGVMKIDRFPVFVPFAIKGEMVRAKVTFVKKDCAFGELVEVVIPSEDRVKPVCPYFGRCGGCDLQHMSAEYQLLLKRYTVQNALQKIAGAHADVPIPIAGKALAYRNKFAAPFAYNQKSGRVSLGFFERRSHKVVPVKWCPVCGEWSGDLIGALTDWANECKISVYDENTGKGLLRHAVARNLDSLCLTLVINGDEIPHKDRLVALLKEKFEEFCIFASPNKKNTNVIFGDEVKLVYGENRRQNLGKFDAEASPKSFLQVNAEIMDKIYDRVAEALEDFDGEVVELYSGIGLLTAQLALRLPRAKICAVEIEPSATKDARELARRLKLEDRVECVCADATEFMQNRKAGAKEALVLDPPRKGCDRRVLQAAIEAGFERIVYVSCNPQTLARDAAILLESYDLKDVQPFDMFAQTAEIETVCVFDKIAKTEV